MCVLFIQALWPKNRCEHASALHTFAILLCFRCGAAEARCSMRPLLYFGIWRLLFSGPERSCWLRRWICALLESCPRARWCVDGHACACSLRTGPVTIHRHSQTKHIPTRIHVYLYYNQHVCAYAPPYKHSYIKTHTLCMFAFVSAQTDVHLSLYVYIYT